MSDAEFCNQLTKCIKKLNITISDSDFIQIKVSRCEYEQPVCEPGHLDRLSPIHSGIRFGRNIAR